ncbi:undecaprenyl-diphosphate phosphatase [Salinisphaera orenii]|uniref:undecaprenyl-diphosphate phosphatase n=1 Tax=Salinisphaera orenii TaxID=856731 RepID=UPI0029700A02
MDWVQLVLVSIMQGLTEFLPISSSAHQILLPHIAGWSDQGVAFDMATNLGTLTAVLVYFRHDLLRLLIAGWQSVFGGRRDHDTRLAWGLIVASVPAIGLGALIGLTVGEAVLRQPWIIAVASIVFGVALGWADRPKATNRALDSLRPRDYLMIGLAQAVALIPGSSRSGMSMFGARALGLDRRASARVSFFMAVPVIGAAIAFEALKISVEPSHTAWSTLGWGALISGVVAMLAIDVFLRVIRAIGMMPFVIYRVLLGVAILLVLTLGG